MEEARSLEQLAKADGVEVDRDKEIGPAVRELDMTRGFAGGQGLSKERPNGIPRWVRPLLASKRGKFSALMYLFYRLSASLY